METLAILFDMPLTAYGAGMALALLVTFAAAAAYLHFTGEKPSAVLRMSVLAVPLALVCSRVVFVLANITYYTVTLSNLTPALWFWDGGYSLTGAVIGVMIAALIAGKLTGAPLADAAGFAAPLGIAVARAFEAGTGMGLGRPISYDWLLFMGIDDGMGDTVYPVFIIEAVVALIILAAVMIWRARARQVRRGDTALVSMTLLPAAQIVLESMRNDGHMVVHFVRIQMVVCLVMLLAAEIIFSRRLILRGGMKKSQQLALWLVTIVCIGLAVFMEFRVDRGSNKLLYYAVMSACVAVITWMTLHCRSKAEQLLRG